MRTTPSQSSFACVFNTTTRATLTNSPNAEQLFTNTYGCITKVDLTACTRCRLNVTVSTASASANTPRLRLRYATSLSNPPVIGDFSDIGTAEVSCTMASVGCKDSGTISLASAAKADVFVCIGELGGDGVADPVVNMVTAHFYTDA